MKKVNEKEKSKIFDVAMKIINGIRLNRREFEIAKKNKIFTRNDIRFEDFDILYYEDNEKRGYLCIKNGKISSEKIGKNEYCMWGIHREDVKPEFLRPEQKKFW
jgi:hypothetical protein